MMKLYSNAAMCYLEIYCFDYIKDIRYFYNISFVQLNIFNMN